MSGAPRVTVIMTTCNGARYIAESVKSVLSQSFTDFEFLIVDDASTDQTPSILAQFADPRIKVVRSERNLGIVGARNYATTLAAGEYIAAHDHDDISLSDRLSLQVSYLDAHPHTVLVGTEVQIMEDQQLKSFEFSFRGSPILLRWRCLIENPLTYSSIMFRKSSILRLGEFLRNEYLYADDFDFYHRVLKIGDIDRLDEPLVIYRVHGHNTSHSVADILDANAVKVLSAAYSRMLGATYATEAALMIQYVSKRRPASEYALLDNIARHIERLRTAFLSSVPISPKERKVVLKDAAEIWWRCVRSSMRQGGNQLMNIYWSYPELARYYSPSRGDILGSVLIGQLRRFRQTAARA